MKGTNTCIWKIEKTIEEIINLMKSDYSKFMEVLSSYQIPENEKKLIYKWSSLEQNFNIKKLTINETEIKYIKALAEIETNAIPTNDWIVDNRVLPKDIRVNKNNSIVLFLESLGSTYCIIIGSKSSEGKIRSTLMESSKRKESRWGKIQFSDVPGFVFDKHFYYWLIKNKGTSLNINNKNIMLNDVRGFKSDTDRKENSYSGEGSNIDLEIPLKSLVSMDERLVSLFVDLKVDNITYNFFLDYDGRISVYRAECGEFATETPKQMSIEEIVMNIYYEIIPLLKSCFNKAISQGWGDIESEFKKSLSIDVIKELIKQNDIQIKEIEEALNLETAEI
ncbi:MAG: hypothetical protein E7206_16250 [Clostridium beijerinckii]|nr:hypothetical protein [Clostridium beijerinckii]